MPGNHAVSNERVRANSRRAAISALVNAPFLISSVLVFQLRMSARLFPGSVAPADSSASIAVAVSFRLSRGGSLSQRVIATKPPGAVCSR